MPNSGAIEPKCTLDFLDRRHRGLRGRSDGKHRGQCPEVQQPLKYCRRGLLGEDVEQLLSDACPGDLREHAHLDSLPSKALSALVHRESVARLEAGSAQHPGRVVDERQPVQHANDAVV